MRRRTPSLRRWLAGGCAAASVAVGLNVLAPDPAPGRPVLVAARDVPAGAALQADDLAVVRRPPADLPRGAVGDATPVLGQVLATALQSGEVLTPARLVGRGLLAGRPAGDVAVPVRMADGAASSMLRPGSRIDVLVAMTDAASARTVARGATVLAAPGADGGSTGPGVGSGGVAASESLLGGGGTDPGQGGLLLLAVPGSTAADLAQAEASGPLSFLIR